MMTGTDLRAAGRKLFGGHGWQERFAIRVGVTNRTVRRWVTLDQVPTRTELLIRGWLKDGLPTFISNGVQFGFKSYAEAEQHAARLMPPAKKSGFIIMRLVDGSSPWSPTLGYFVTDV